MSKLSLSVTPTAKPTRPSSVMTGPGDLRDQHWLDDQVEAIEVGFEAVVNIARNWTDGRNLSRLHPGVSAAEYVTSRVGTLGKAVVPVLLAESNWSNRQIAAVAGVSEGTVRNVSGAQNYAPERGPVLGADGKLYEPRTVVAEVIDLPKNADDRWNPGALMSSESPEWYTPRHVLEAAVTALGSIDLDPCAEPGKGVPAAIHLTEAEDGLRQSWAGKVYMNPPYGRTIGDWTGKLAESHKAGSVTEAIALLPARTETDWWASLDAEWVCLIHGRLAFSDAATTAPFPSAAVYLGPNGEWFADSFGHLGPVYRRWSA